MVIPFLANQYLMPMHAGILAVVFYFTQLALEIPTSQMLY